MYNLTALQNAQYVTDLIVVANNVTDNLFVESFIVILFLIFVIMFKRDDISDAILASSFVCFIISLFLRTVQMVDILFVFAFLILMGVTLLWMQVKGK